MGERVQKRAERHEEAPVVDEVDAQKIGDVAAQGADIKADLDAMLDEIDGVLEQNAEEFVKSYIQKSGQ